MIGRGRASPLTVPLQAARHADERSDRALRPIVTSARGRLTEIHHGLVVPATALIARASGPQVAAVQTDGTVHYLGVQLGRDLGQSVEIVSGLTGNERLVVSPPDGLKEGGRVAAEEGK